MASPPLPPRVTSRASRQWRHPNKTGPGTASASGAAWNLDCVHFACVYVQSDLQAPHYWLLGRAPSRLVFVNRPLALQPMRDTLAYFAKALANSPLNALQSLFVGCAREQCAARTRGFLYFLCAWRQTNQPFSYKWTWPLLTLSCISCSKGERLREADHTNTLKFFLCIGFCKYEITFTCAKYLICLAKDNDLYYTGFVS